MRAAISPGRCSGAGAEIKGISVAPGAPLPDALVHLKAGSIEGLRERATICRESFSARGWRDSIGAVVGQAR